jgi:hypothetical protein
VPTNGKQPYKRPADGAADPSPPKVLYGYIRAIRGDVQRAAVLKADLQAFCQTHGFMLGTVFTDWGVEDTAIARPGFSSLLDVCKLVGSHGVIVPARSHLSSHAETLATLTRQIRRTGAVLIAADKFEADLHGATTASDRPHDTAEESS